ncbi:MFS transporter [Rubeoparvulum massiliense]|uniref:MFS transporter n=1 Tax=Rubeoparvulum massiliense TaxID=1631346 RepID=UPI00097783B0|nr:MFS transporter [Rubeoparvulum massiliense]
MQYIQQGERRYWQANTSLFAGGFVTFALLYCTQPLLPVFSEEFGVSPTVASLSVSFSTATLAIAIVFASQLAERLGRKTLMSWSLLLSSLLAFFIVLVPQFQLLLAIRLLQGFFLAGFPAIAMAYIGEEYHPKSIITAMGLYVSGTAIGGMTGRILIGVITDLADWRWAVVILALLSLASAFWFWRYLPEPTHTRPHRFTLSESMKTYSMHLLNPRLLPLFLLAFLFMGSFVTMFNYLTYRLVLPPFSLSQSLVGWIFIIYLLGTVSSNTMGLVRKRFGDHWTLLINISMMFIGIQLTMVEHLWIVILGLGCFTFGFFGSHSTASSLVGARAEDHKAHASSLYLLFYYLGSSIIGAGGGWFWSQFGWRGIGGLLSILQVCSLLLLLLMLRFHKKNIRSKNKFEKMT